MHSRPIIRSVLLRLWALPTTVPGLVLLAAGFASGTRARVVDGVIEAHGGRLLVWLLTHATILPGGASAVTFGHVVLARSADDLNRTRAHERVHVRQAERWGPAFIPAYLLASLVCHLRGQDAYLGNPFEVQAYRDS